MDQKEARSSSADMIPRFLFLILLLSLAACVPAEPVSPTQTSTWTPAPSPTATIIWFPPTATPELIPTQALTPTPELGLELGEILFEDLFLEDEGWELPQSDRGKISIGQGEISIVINEPGSFFAATREKPDLQDFYAEITANPVLCSAEDEYGFLFRVTGRDQYYRFALNCGGEIRLDRIVSDTGNLLVPWTRSASVPPGAPSLSKLAVLVVGDQIFGFINGDPQFSVQDPALKLGSFGVYARSVGDSPVTVSFSELIVREVLPKN